MFNTSFLTVIANVSVGTFYNAFVSISFLNYKSPISWIKMKYPLTSMNIYKMLAVIVLLSYWQ